MKQLWSPWRMEYIESLKQDGCVFCQTIEEEDGKENLIIVRGETSFVILNRYPYTSGHIMVLPFIHIPKLSEIDQKTRTEMMELVSKATEVLQRVYKPEGFNVGINMGEAAGAGIEDHLHIHIVPRWKGDTNFMSAVGETRVLPEELEETHRRICAAWQASSSENISKQKIGENNGNQQTK